MRREALAEILWVNPVGTGDFDAETVELIDAVRAERHALRDELLTHAWSRSSGGAS